MKNLLSLILIFTSFSAFANDVIFLSDGSCIEGNIEKFKNNAIRIKTDQGNILIPNEKILVVSLDQELSNIEKIKLGKLDGKRYAKNKGGNIVLGALTGFFGVTIVYMTSEQIPSNKAMFKSANKAIINDAFYLKGYESGARSKSGQNALIGFVAWMAFFLLAHGA